MDIESTPNRKVHHGLNVKRFREMLGIKQEVLGDAIGVAQQTISNLEKEAVIKDEILEKIAKELNIPVEAIKNFDEEKAINIVANTFHEDSGGYITNYKCTFNPLEKVIELYERIIKDKEEQNALLRQLLQEKK